MVYKIRMYIFMHSWIEHTPILPNNLILPNILGFGACLIIRPKAID